MQRSMLFFVLICLILACGGKTEQSTSTETMDDGVEFTNNGGLIHTVYFYFNDTLDSALANDFTLGLEELSKIDLIQHSYFGPPAGTDREVVDNTYAWAWIAHFKNKEDQDAYQVDSVHLAFIEKYKSLWKEVKVYDNLVVN